MSAATCTTAAVPRRRHPSTLSRARVCVLLSVMSLATPLFPQRIVPSWTAEALSMTKPLSATRAHLEAMTVRELKLYVKESGLVVPRGEASKLMRLKGGIVDFILDSGGPSSEKDAHVDAAAVVAESPQINGAEKSDEDESTESRRKSDDAPKKTVQNRKAGTGMPPLPSSGAAVDDDAVADTDDGVPPPPQKYINKKNQLVKDVLDRYPGLREAVAAGCAADGVDDVYEFDLASLQYTIPNQVGDRDVRAEHHPMLEGLVPTDMDVIFIGTASCTPGITRGVSCTAIRLNWRGTGAAAMEGTRGHVKPKGVSEEDRGQMGGTWIFDCGEATQLSVQRTSSVKPGKISKIFITHCHGDHSFGLPGLLCLMGTDRDRDAPPVEIYGPEGLRAWLRVAIRYSTSRVVPPYRVHELMDVPMAPEWDEGHRRNGRYYYQLKKEGGKNGAPPWGTKGLAGEDPKSWISRAPMTNLEPSRDFGEIDGGRDIYPRYDHPACVDGAPIWEVENEGDVAVYAAPMSHGVPCVGYVVREQDQPGRLRPELVEPVVKRNFKELVAAGMRNPMKMMAVIKNLSVGDTYTFPDGTVMRQEDVVEAPRKGRKIVICGDTADGRAIGGLAQGADVLIHEATNTFLQGIDKATSFQVVAREAKVHGHSTPYMAGEFAKQIGAKKLVMNHFSARYKGDQSLESMTIMTRIERSAIECSGLPENAVACAWDFMVLPVPRN